MKLEYNFLAVAVVSIALAVPVALAAQHRTHQLKIEKTHNSSLQIKLDSKQEQIKKQELEKQELQKKIDEQNKQLQSKRDKMKEAQLTAARASKRVPVAVSKPVGGGCESYRPLVAQYGWEVSTAMAVMRAESGCNPVARSASRDSGLFQVNDVHLAKVNYNQSALYDPATNVKVAFQVYSGAGWRAWTVFKTGAYLKYL